MSLPRTHFLPIENERAVRAKANRCDSLREEKKSWYHVIHQLGATITPESWDPSSKGNMTFSHAWGTAPANIIVRNLCGIVPLEAGCRKLMIKPQAGDLARVRVTAPTIRGSVSMDLDLTAQRMTVTLPANIVADIYVPYHNPSASGITMDGNEKEAEKTKKIFRDTKCRFRNPHLYCYTISLKYTTKGLAQFSSEQGLKH